jgi:hypothetical protein
MAGEVQTNLPAKVTQDSGQRTKLFFDTYGKEPLSYKVPDIDAAIQFFSKKGFSDPAANLSAVVLLKQAKLENIPINQILDTLRGFDNLQVSALVGEIMNNHRPSTSTLGYRQPSPEVNKERNVVA